ncbi:MAG: tyrosine-type recombinase/integrase [Xanthobacteraceae bacterium]
MSVRKRTWNGKNGQEREAWIVDYVDQAGDRHIKTFERKKEADAYHATVNVEVASGTHTAPRKSLTLSEAGDLWIATCKARGLERTTIDFYRQHLKLHICPYLGRRKLPELTLPLIRQFEDDLRSGKPPPGAVEGTARSAVMTKRVLTSLGSLLADAQERGELAQNVVRSLRAGRGRGKDRRVERRLRKRLKVGVDIPTPDEIRRIVHALPGSRWRPLLLTAIFTGLRASELRGLRWEDIDLSKRELHVRQRADRYKKIGQPKSESGQRTVPLPPIVVEALREWKLSYPRPILAENQREPAKAQHLVFPTGTGQVEDHSNILRRGLEPIQVAAGVTNGKTPPRARYTGLHALRHFYASWCINRKADGGLELPPKLVQERLGHSSIVITLDLYGHLFARGDDGAELADAEHALLG